MGRFLAFSFLFVYAIAMVKPAAPFIDYVLRYDHISKVLCINKDIPESTCNGKCFLSQQIKKAAEAEKNRPFTPPKIELEEYTISENELFNVGISEVTSPDHSALYINHYEYYKSNEVFRPPVS
ncbi:MAG: hypothetical protein HRT72_12645 [Flavobacteriales bacterium]|nr:hypothetical protein [Flavobacteriales bacterium]